MKRNPQLLCAVDMRERRRVGYDGVRYERLWLSRPDRSRSVSIPARCWGSRNRSFIASLKARAPTGSHDVAHSSSSPLYLTLPKGVYFWLQAWFLDLVCNQFRSITANTEEFQPLSFDKLLKDRVCCNANLMA